SSAALALPPFPTRRSSDLQAEDALQRPGDLLGVGVREPDRLFLQRAAGGLLGGGLLGGELAGGGLLLLQLGLGQLGADLGLRLQDRKSTRLNSSHEWISYA